MFAILCFKYEINTAIVMIKVPKKECHTTKKLQFEKITMDYALYHIVSSTQIDQ